MPPRPPGPRVRLGPLTHGGIAPSLFVLVERGAGRSPGMAAATRGEVVLAFDEGYPPVSIRFGEEGIEVGEEPSETPDVTISGSLPALSALLVTPLFGGVPRSREGLARLARREIRISGRRGLARRLIALIALDPRR